MAEEKELSPEILKQQSICEDLAKQLKEQLTKGNYSQGLIGLHNVAKLKLYDMKTAAGISI